LLNNHITKTLTIDKFNQEVVGKSYNSGFYLGEFVIRIKQDPLVTEEPPETTNAAGKTKTIKSKKTNNTITENTVKTSKVSSALKSDTENNTISQKNDPKQIKIEKKPKFEFVGKKLQVDLKFSAKTFVNEFSMDLVFDAEDYYYFGTSDMEITTVIARDLELEG
jgi:hypothetical protein